MVTMQLADVLSKNAHLFKNFFQLTGNSLEKSQLPIYKFKITLEYEIC